MMKMTQQERQAQETFKAVAALLEWKYVQTQYTTANLLKPGTEYKISCYYNSYKNTMTYTGIFPQHLDRHSKNNNERFHSISISPLKEPAKIVHCIQLRLLPSYLATWVLLDQRNKEYIKRDIAQQSLAMSIAEHGNGSTVKQGKYQREDIYKQEVIHFGSKKQELRGKAPWGKAEVDRYGSLLVRMELHNIPQELAEYIASLLGEWSDE